MVTTTVDNHATGVVAHSSSNIIERGEASPEEALEFYSMLQPISDIDMICGNRWKGNVIKTNHPMDWMLQAMDWYGKEFVSKETVHPLLFRHNNYYHDDDTSSDNDTDDSFYYVASNVTATKMMMKMPFLQDTKWKWLLRLTTTSLKTNESQARLRLVEDMCGKSTVTMIYDYLPTMDHFRLIDKDTIMGVMDSKSTSTEGYCFFTLKREKQV